MQIKECMKRKREINDKGPDQKCQGEKSELTSVQRNRYYEKNQKENKKHR